MVLYTLHFYDENGKSLKATDAFQQPALVFQDNVLVIEHKDDNGLPTYINLRGIGEIKIVRK